MLFPNIYMKWTKASQCLYILLYIVEYVKTIKMATELFLLEQT
jgi:hypothetical protein